MANVILEEIYDFNLCLLQVFRAQLFRLGLKNAAMITISNFPLHYFRILKGIKNM